MFELGLVCFPIRKKPRIPGRLEIDGSGNPKIVRTMIGIVRAIIYHSLPIRECPSAIEDRQCQTVRVHYREYGFWLRT